jgi:hypothetical protein
VGPGALKLANHHKQAVLANRLSALLQGRLELEAADAEEAVGYEVPLRVLLGKQSGANACGANGFPPLLSLRWVLAASIKT